MDDLISRKALDREMSMQLVHAGFKSYSDAGQMYLKAKQIVRSAPAVDAAPVVHGRWIFNQEQWTWDCTNCKGWVGSGVRIRGYEYCPNCGAKMDGGNDDENFSSLRRKPGSND